MKALVYDGDKIELSQVPVPNPGPGEALIRVLIAGVCRTDIEIVKGYMDFSGIPGHEFVGVVEKCDQAQWTGKRVVGEINIPCRECPYCGRGLERHCPQRKVLGIQGKDGAFAEYLTLPAANLHEVPEGMALKAAVFVEPVAACFEILEQVDVSGLRVAVLGDGKLGILAARVLATAGPAELILAGRHPDKLALLEQEGTRTMLASELALLVSDPAQKFDLIVEATGRAEGFAAAQDAVRPRGTIVQKTTVAGRAQVDLSRVVVDEVTVIGSRCGPFLPALQAIHSGRVRVDDLVSGSFDLSQGDKALQAAMQPGVLKVLIEV